MTRQPLNIYNSDRQPDITDRAAQIRHLSLIGLAARNSIWNIRNLDDAYISLFEIIASLASEIEHDFEEIQS